MEFVFRRSYRGAVKAVILDWAGTTVDYGSFAPVMAFVEVFKERGVPISIDEARRPMGVHKKEHIRAITQITQVTERWREVHGRAPDEGHIEAMYQDFIPRQVQVLADYADPIPGTQHAMAEFRARGIKVGSTTGYNAAMMDALAPEAEKRGYKPDSIVCSTDVPAGRPEPWMALKSAMEMRLFPMEAIVKVGDTLPDIAEGLNAGMWTIGVAKTGNGLGMSLVDVSAMESQTLREKLDRVYESMYQAGAHFVVDGINDVPTVLDRISARLGRGEHPIG